MVLSRPCTFSLKSYLAVSRYTTRNFKDSGHCAILQKWRKSQVCSTLAKKSSAATYNLGRYLTSCMVLSAISASGSEGTVLPGSPLNTAKDHLHVTRYSGVSPRSTVYQTRILLTLQIGIMSCLPWKTRKLILKQRLVEQISSGKLKSGRG